MISSTLSRDEFYCAATRVALTRFLAHKSLSKPFWTSQLVKQECFAENTGEKRAMWPKYILLHTKNKLQESFTRELES